MMVLKDFINRVKFGALLMCVSVFGIPFIPLVPIIVLFGGFKANDGIGGGLASVAFTMLFGIVSYTAVAIAMVHGL